MKVSREEVVGRERGRVEREGKEVLGLVRCCFLPFFSVFLSFFVS